MPEARETEIPKYGFREAQSLEEVGVLTREAAQWRGEKGESLAQTVYRAVDWKRYSPDKTHVYVIENQTGEVVCFARMDLLKPRGLVKQAYFHSRVVKPGQEGQGLGSMMVEKRLIEARDVFKCTSVVTEAAKDNPAAVRSIIKHGFIVPDYFASHKTKYQLYKELSGVNLNLPTPNEPMLVSEENYFSGKKDRVRNIVIGFGDHRLIQQALEYGYSIVGMRPNGKQGDAELILSKLPEAVRKDPNWGFKNLDRLQL